MPGTSDRAPKWPLRRRHEVPAVDDNVLDESIPSEDVATRSIASSAVESEMARLRANAQNHSSDRQPLRGEVIGRQQAMRSPSSAIGISEEPSWVEVLKADIQSNIRMELAEIYEKWIGPPLKRDIQAAFERNSSEMRELMQKDVRRPSSIAEEKSIEDAPSTPHGGQVRSISNDVNECSELTLKPGAAYSSVTNAEGATHPAPGPTGTEKVDRFRPSLMPCFTQEHEKIMLSCDQFVQNLHTSPDFGGRPSWGGKVEFDEMKSPAALGQLFGMDDEAALDERMYVVESLYHDTGWPQAMARSPRFQTITMAVIGCNVFYIGYASSVDNPPSVYNAAWYFIVLENVFCTYFTFELLVRLFAFRHMRNCLMDGWFRFDTFLVLFSILETWVLAPLIAISGFGVKEFGVVRTLRLLRVMRISRLAHLLPELFTICKGILFASRAVGSTMIMNTLLVYAFGIATHSFLEEEHALNDKLKANYTLSFKTIGDSMWALTVLMFTLDGTGNVFNELYHSKHNANTVCAFVLLWIFFLLAAVTILNMLVGVLVDVVKEVAQFEKDEYTTRVLKATILTELLAHDDGDGLISRQEFRTVMSDEHSVWVLHKLRVDVLFLRVLESMCFPAPDSNVPIRTVVDMMLQSRKGNPTTIQHFSSGLSFLQNEVLVVQNMLMGIHNMMSQVTHTRG